VTNLPSTANERNGEGPVLLTPGTTAVGPSGLSWEYEGRHSDDHLPILGHEMMIVAMARSMMPEGGTAIDVGAHVGLYALEFARKGRCIAWEANLSTCHKLARNALINRLKVEIVSNAAWDQEGTVHLQDPNGFETGGSTQVHEGRGERMVSALPLDYMLEWTDTRNKLTRVDLIKIDVEGAEIRVLCGAEKLITKFQPRLIIEMHDFIVGAENRTRVEMILEEFGYEHGSDIPNGEGYTWMCKPKETI
jgi:FkbM family methyltransferase